jgi:hypothetical protein
MPILFITYFNHTYLFVFIDILFFVYQNISRIFSHRSKLLQRHCIFPDLWFERRWTRVSNVISFGNVALGFFCKSVEVEWEVNIKE